MRPPSPSQVVTFPRVVLSEWVKLRSLDSALLAWVLMLLALVGVGWGLGYLVGGDASLRPGRQDTFDPTNASLQGVYLAQLAAGALGVLTVSGEYASGTIRSTFAAVPRRRTVVLAKAVAFGVTTFALALLGALTSFFGTQLLVARSTPPASLADPGVVRAVIGAALYLALVGLVGMGLGWITRDATLGVTFLLALLLLAPAMAAVAPEPWGERVAPYLPALAGQSVFLVDAGAGRLPPGAGALVLVGWAALSLGEALRRVPRNDA